MKLSKAVVVSSIASICATLSPTVLSLSILSSYADRYLNALGIDVAVVQILRILCKKDWSVVSMPLNMHRISVQLDRL